MSAKLIMVDVYKNAIIFLDHFNALVIMVMKVHIYINIPTILFVFSITVFTCSAVYQ